MWHFYKSSIQKATWCSAFQFKCIFLSHQHRLMLKTGDYKNELLRSRPSSSVEQAQERIILIVLLAHFALSWVSVKISDLPGSCLHLDFLCHHFMTTAELSVIRSQIFLPKVCRMRQPPKRHDVRGIKNAHSPSLKQHWPVRKVCNLDTPATGNSSLKV